MGWKHTGVAAREAGVEASTLRHWAKDNPDVENGTRGVYVWYTDDDKIDWDVCETARYLAKAGKDAFLWGAKRTGVHGIRRRGRTGGSILRFPHADIPSSP